MSFKNLLNFILAYSLSSEPQTNGSVEPHHNKEINRSLSEQDHGNEIGNKIEDAPQNAVIKNIKSDILNGFTQRRLDEGGFKVSLFVFNL